MIVSQDVRLAQLDRAFGYGPKGREFESSNARMKVPEGQRKALHRLECFFSVKTQYVIYLTNV